MKKILIIISIITLSFHIIIATPIDLETSRNVTENFLNEKEIEYQIIDQYTLSNESEELVHVFNTEPSGFVAIAADTDVYPIIAYSFHNQMQAVDQTENVLFDMLKDDVEQRLEYYHANSIAARENHAVWNEYLSGDIFQRNFQQWPVPGSTLTDGWIETRWNQSGIFYQLCPLDSNGERCVVGCVATAMAMIIDFHEEVGDVYFNNSDDYYSGWWNQIHIDNDHDERDFPSFPEFNVYLDDLEYHYENEMELTDIDKAALSFACGVSVEMNYGSDGSGAWTSSVAGALLSKFDYDTSIWIDNTGGYFYEQLRTNMIEMRPVEISIYQSNGSGGHAIIVDGYNTNDYYHLNYGWGTSNSTCWYLLPEGMPSGYQNGIIGGGVMEIEAGDIPVELSGQLDVAAVSAQGAFITLTGNRLYECWVTDPDGSFEFPAVEEGYYDVTAVLENRIYYAFIEDVYINADNNFLQITMGNYEAVTGSVNASVNAEGCQIDFYQDGIRYYSGNADYDGNYSVPDVLPGIYQATASLNGDYFQSREVEISLDNLTIDFELEEYPGDLHLSYAGFIDGIWTLGPDLTITCALKLTPEELNHVVDDLLAGIRFKAPVSMSDGEIWVQVWQDDILLLDQNVVYFEAGEWVDVTLNSILKLDPELDYYIGYKIYSLTGDLAYHDQGPQQSGKGAYFRINGWNPLPAVVNDFNFCIDAVFASDNFGTISGNVLLENGSGNVENVSIQADLFVTNPDVEGDYSIQVKPSFYDLLASLSEYSMETIYGIDIESDDNLFDQDFLLTSLTGANEDDVTQAFWLGNNYPNPFNPVTTIDYSVAENNTRVKISVYNLKGQKVKTLVDSYLNKGIHSVTWNGEDDKGRSMPSGVYLYKIDARDYQSARKMILLK